MREDVESQRGGRPGWIHRSSAMKTYAGDGWMSNRQRGSTAAIASAGLWSAAARIFQRIAGSHQGWVLQFRAESRPGRGQQHPLLELPPGEAMTLAEEDIRDNWELYQAEFLRRNRR
jgi:hypothetical protein